METNNQKTFSNQINLPRLSIPTLKETAERYKKSLLPLLSTSDYNRAANVVDEFMKEGGFAEVLQKRLYDVDKSEKYNWIETIRLNKFFLELRVPILIYSNWWIEFNDPVTGILENPPKKGQTSEFQIDRAAGLVSNMLTFNDMINNELLPQDKTRHGLLCMDQYTKLFSTARIADSPFDRVITTWPKTAKHIIVIFKDQIFKVQVLGARKRLESLSAENNISFEAIDTALFGVALDDYPTDTNIDVSHHNCIHAYNGRNRWFDKTIQLIFANNGRAGVNGEHSSVDGTVVGRLFNYIISNESAQDPQNTSPLELPPPQYLKWFVDTYIINTIQQAQINIQAAIDNIDSVLLYYNEYGSNWIKNAKVSPDAFVQIAIQLAYYKRYGESCSTYETASTRGFLHGRLETLRTCSVDTTAFTKAFCDPNIEKDEIVSLLMKAIKSHTEYIISAINGRGVDCHLLGLQSQIHDGEKSRATLFTDPSYAQAMHFKLRTSNLSPGLGFHTGMETIVPDAYAIAYIIEKDKLKIGISSNKKCKETDSVIFRKALKESLNDLREILS
ncbi:16599_t:CDS:2 [Dentiscutata erythropus]|uniref:16599_t:CDS:1 n=1 Tax=Dentiscutata erythropus TaxID=1348616 RepID=A0A9N9EXJ6_9GLOM|nr:16599_t:CDS:2 [Dentiscutata erythropus]